MYFHDLFCAEGKAKKFKKYRNYVRFLKNSLIRVSFLTCSVHNCHRLSPKGIKLLVKYVVVYYTVLQIYMHRESFVKKNPQFTKFQIFVFNKIGFKSRGEHKLLWLPISPGKRLFAYISAIQCMYADATSSFQICLGKAMHKFPSALSLFFSLFQSYVLYILSNIPSNLEFIPTHLREFPLYSGEIVISKVIEYAIEA